jgi:hypothetical protein
VSGGLAVVDGGPGTDDDIRSANITRINVP